MVSETCEGCAMCNPLWFAKDTGEVTEPYKSLTEPDDTVTLEIDGLVLERAKDIAASALKMAGDSRAAWILCMAAAKLIEGTA